MWAPEQLAKEKDLLITTGDYLRLWQVTDSDVRLEGLYNNVGPPPTPLFSLVQHMSISFPSGAEQEQRILRTSNVV